MTRKQAIKAFGTITALSKATGYSRQAIWKWKGPLSFKVCNAIEGALIKEKKWHRSPRTNGI